MDNKELTKAIIVIILEELNGYSHDEAMSHAEEYNGDAENKIYELLEKQRPNLSN